MKIYQKPVLVTLMDGSQLSGLITSQTYREDDKERVTRISILENKPLGIPVSILTADIKTLEVIDETNPH